MTLSSAMCLSVLVCLTVLAAAGPVQVRIETDNQNNFHVGPGHRQTFELTEEYRPLSTAFNPKQRSRPVPVSRGAPPPSVTARMPLPTAFSNVHVLDVEGTQVRIVDASPADLHKKVAPANCTDEKKVIVTPRVTSGFIRTLPQTPQHSRWMEWTRWSDCVGGQRVRVRNCLMVNGVQCRGENTETQKCFSFMQSDIPFAKDPMVIEKEILGIDMDAPVARV